MECNLPGFPEYGYVTDMSIFKGTPLEEFTTNSEFVVFSDGDLFLQKIIKKHDRVLKTVQRFTSAQSSQEQWAYYKRFLLAEPSYLYNERPVTKYLAKFDEVGLVQIDFQNSAMITTSKDGSEIISIVKMKNQEYVDLITALKEAGQIVKEIR